LSLSLSFFSFSLLSPITSFPIIPQGTTIPHRCWLSSSSFSAFDL
jgi:hypothetical protein